MRKATNVHEFADFRIGAVEDYSSLGCFFSSPGAFAQSFETLRPQSGLETQVNKLQTTENNIPGE